MERPGSVVSRLFELRRGSMRLPGSRVVPEPSETPKDGQAVESTDAPLSTFAPAEKEPGTQTSASTHHEGSAKAQAAAAGTKDEEPQDLPAPSLGMAVAAVAASELVSVERVMRVMPRGSHFGEVALVASATRICNVRARAFCEVIQPPPPDCPEHYLGIVTLRRTCLNKLAHEFAMLLRYDCDRFRS